MPVIKLKHIVSFSSEDPVSSMFLEFLKISSHDLIAEHLVTPGSNITVYKLMPFQSFIFCVENIYVISVVYI